MKSIAILLAATFLVADLHAQSPSAPQAAHDETSNPRLWQAKFANGHYMVRLDRICSASKHEYISDSVARVVEVTIGTDAAVVARFYYLEPVGKDTPISSVQIAADRLKDIQQTVASKTSPSLGKLQVVKNYPASTHAHTVEYVLQTEDALTSLYTSLTTSINTGTGRTWVDATK